jgi:AraC-like DNA-binding protein
MGRIALDADELNGSSGDNGSMANATATACPTPTVADDTAAPGERPCSLQMDAGPPVVYREYAPPAGLKPYVVCTWTLDVRAGQGPHRQHVLPDGCSDIIWMGEARPIVVGPMTRPALSTVAEGTALIGVRFRPEATAAVLGVPANELADRRIALDELWSRHVVSAASEQLWEQRTAAERIGVVQSLIASRRDQVAALPDATVQHVISRLAAYRPDGIRELAREAGISERQLRRRFLTAAGYSPKMLQRIVRFQKLLALARDQPARLGDAAHTAGYADQAHMTREVGEFAGVTPSALLGKVDSALALYDLLLHAHR